MCAYLIKEEDKNIEEPIARIAIKRFVGTTNDAFIFACENRIYGDTLFATELDFLPTVKNIIKTSNNITSKNQGIFTRKDANSYSDNGINSIINLDNIDWNTISKSKIDSISKNIDLSKAQIEKYADKLNLTLFVYKLFDNLPYQNTNGDLWDNKTLKKFIDEYHDKINVTQIFNKLSGWNMLEQVNILKKYLDPSKITKNLDELPITYVLKHLNKFNILKILANAEDSETAISKFDKKMLDQIGWDKISANIKLFTYELTTFFEKYKDYINWDIITKRICKHGFSKIENLSLMEGFSTEYSFEGSHFIYRYNLNYDMLSLEYDFTGYNIPTIINWFNFLPQDSIKLSLIFKNPTLSVEAKQYIKKHYKDLKIKKDI